MFKPIKGLSLFTIIVEGNGIVIEHRTPEREVGDSTYQHRVCVLDLDTLTPKRNKSTGPDGKQRLIFKSSPVI